LYRNPKKLKSYIANLKCHRSSVIPYFAIGLKTKVYNGHHFVNTILRQRMIGHKFGEFSVTKIMGSRIAARKREKQKKLLKKSGKK